MLFSLGLAGDMVGQEAGSGLWSGVSGVPGELSLFREFLPASFFIFCLGSFKNTTFLGLGVSIPRPRHSVLEEWDR